jgi:hypothetical protein
MQVVARQIKPVKSKTSEGSARPNRLKERKTEASEKSRQGLGKSGQADQYHHGLNRSVCSSLQVQDCSFYRFLGLLHHDSSRFVFKHAEFCSFHYQYIS